MTLLRIILTYVYLRGLLYFNLGVKANLLDCVFDNKYLIQPTTVNYGVLEKLDFVDPMKCAEECLLRTGCLGLSVERFMCLLYIGRSDSLGKSFTKRVVNFIPRTLWPTRMSGLCEIHVTKYNEKCAITETGQHHSIITGCSGPTVDQGGVHYGGHEPGTLWHLNSSVPFSCKKVGNQTTVPLGKLICRSGGTWSLAICVRPLPTCSAVQKCNGSYRDGEYFLTIGRQRKIMKIFCHGMNSRKPTMFVTLPEGNYGRITAPYTTNPTCALTNPHRGNIHCGDTYWNKVRISKLKPWVGEIDLERYEETYFNVTCPGGFLGFGSTIDCSERTGCQADQMGSIRVNTTGTGMKLIPKRKMWTKIGSAKVADCRLSNDGQVADISCYGFRRCGWCLPYPPSKIVFMSIDRLYEPEADSAVSPKCVDHH